MSLDDDRDGGSMSSDDQLVGRRIPTLLKVGPRTPTLHTSSINSHTISIHMNIHECVTLLLNYIENLSK